MRRNVTKLLEFLNKTFNIEHLQLFSSINDKYPEMSYISKTKGGITDTKISCSVTHLFWLSLGPIVQSVLTYENPILGFVDQCVKWHKGHNAGQRETAGFNLHSNLKSNTTQ